MRQADSVQQLSLISKVRGGIISVIARFQRIVLDFLVFCTFDPTMDTRACVSTRRLLTICEYILCLGKRSARSPWFWSSCVCPLVDYTNSDPFPYLLSSWFENGYCWIYWEMTSRYCLCIPVVYVSFLKVDLVASPDEYRLCIFSER